MTPLPRFSEMGHLRYCIPPAPADRLPREGETIYSKALVADYAIDAETGCWNWLKSTLRGYPQGGNVGKPHRLYYERAHGPIAPGCDVHHKCHNRRCLNPDHLEAIPHGQHVRSHARTWSVLTEAQVAEIRSLVGFTAVQLAERYGCTVSNINSIRRRESWHGVGPDLPDHLCDECGEPITEGMRNKRYCTELCKRKSRERRRLARKAA